MSKLQTLKFTDLVPVVPLSTLILTEHVKTDIVVENIKEDGIGDYGPVRVYHKNSKYYLMYEEHLVTCLMWAKIFDIQCEVNDSENYRYSEQWDEIVSRDEVKGDDLKKWNTYCEIASREDLATNFVNLYDFLRLIENDPNHDFRLDITPHAEEWK